MNDTELPISVETLKRLLCYTYADAKTYEDLTETERGLMTRDEFETIREWAVGEKT